LIETLQLEPTIEVHDAPKLLVQWSSPWQEFVSSVGPALAKSDARLAGEAPFGLVPYRIMVPSYVLEAFLIFAAIAIQVKIAELRPYVAPRISPHDVIYYSGDELPRTEDLGGAEAGTTAEAGGQEAHHRTQTIRIARGASLAPKVVDAPNLKLPSSRDAVANLLAIRPDPGPPPSEGMRSGRRTPNLQTQLVAPAPDMIRDYTRNGVAMEQVIAPAPTLSRTQPLTAPNLSASVIPPSADVAHDHALVAPVLVPAVVPPAPNVSRDRARSAPSLNAGVVAPAPEITRDQMRSGPAVATTVIPPAPGIVTRQISRAPVQATDAAVVPPPVTAPERAVTGNPKLTLPAPAVIAPPPAEVSQDVRRLATGSAHDPFKAVVPPPPSQPSGGSFMSSLIGKILGPTEVVQPPPSVDASGMKRSSTPALAPNVVAPPPSVAANAAAGTTSNTRSSGGTSLTANVIAPPAAGVSDGAGSRASAAPMLGPQTVVAPPPSLSGPGGGTGNTAGGAGLNSGKLIANNIIPPPPSMGGGSNTTGSGLGRKGVGLGSPMDVGSNVAPTNSAGSAKNAGVVLSSQPGPTVGLPRSGGPGALAMSPPGGDKVGIGGSGGGTGIGHGGGSGSSLNGEGTGAAKTSTGRGSDPNARGGISPSAGPGGAGNAPSGVAPVPGVSVSGGTNMVTLPSFGSDAGPGDPPSTRTTLKPRQTLEVTVVGTANSGGAFEPYKNQLRGEKYTTYIDTSLGTVVMEFASPAAPTGFGVKLSSPQSVRTTLPAGLPHSRMVVACTLDASGNVRNVRVLEAGPAEMTAKVVAALNGWKFQPAMRGDQPVEVTAILGFGINTNDRF